MVEGWPNQLSRSLDAAFSTQFRGLQRPVGKLSFKFTSSYSLARSLSFQKNF